MPRVFSAMLYFLPPAAALVLAMPLAGSGRFDTITAAIVAPFYLGLAAAPGYIYCWAVRARAVEVSARVRWWIRTSLTAALAASVGGIIGGCWMILFVIPSVPTAVLTLRLWWIFEGGGHKKLTTRIAI